MENRCGGTHLQSQHQEPRVWQHGLAIWAPDRQRQEPPWISLAWHPCWISQWSSVPREKSHLKSRRMTWRWPLAFTNTLLSTHMHNTPPLTNTHTHTHTKKIISIWKFGFCGMRFSIYSGFEAFYSHNILFYFNLQTLKLRFSLSLKSHLLMYFCCQSKKMM